MNVNDASMPTKGSHSIVQKKHQEDFKKPWDWCLTDLISKFNASREFVFVSRLVLFYLHGLAPERDTL